MGPVPPADATNDLSNAEIEELLDAPESAEEKAALDQIVSDPEEVLRRVKERLRRGPPPEE